MHRKQQTSWCSSYPHFPQSRSLTLAKFLTVGHMETNQCTFKCHSGFCNWSSCEFIFVIGWSHWRGHKGGVIKVTVMWSRLLLCSLWMNVTALLLYLSNFLLRSIPKHSEPETGSCCHFMSGEAWVNHSHYQALSKPCVPGNKPVLF